MTKSIRSRSAAAILVAALVVLPSTLFGQTSFSFNIVTNDATDFKVQVMASTSTSPNTVGSATIDIEYDDLSLTYSAIDAGNSAIKTHNNTWFSGCLVATGDAGGCAAGLPYGLSGSDLNDGTAYIRVTIIPNITVPIGTQTATTPGYTVDGYELPGSPNALFQLNFTKVPPSPAGGSVAKSMAPEDLTFRTNTLSFGYFENLDNTPETGAIVDDCNQSVGNGCDVTNSESLPVELTDFVATVDQGDVLLSWNTASETDNAGFSVEHAVGAEGSFEEIAFVEGAGTSLEPRPYSYTVKGLDVGVHRFRLKQLDYDGAFEFSSVVETTIELAGTHRLGAAYPNPFNPSTTFELVVGREQLVKIDIINALGQRVQRLFEGTMEANRPTNFVFQASNLPTGLYFYRVIGENFAQTRQVLLVK